MGFLGLREDILAVKFFEGFPKVTDYTSSRIFLVSSHAWLYPQFESISWIFLIPFLGLSFWLSLTRVSWLFLVEFSFCPFFDWGFLRFDWPMTFVIDLGSFLSLSLSLSLFCFFFLFFFFQLETHLMDSNTGSYLPLGPCNHLTRPSMGG